MIAAFFVERLLDLVAQAEYFKDEIHDASHYCAYGNGDDPGPEQVDGYAPAYGRKPFRSAHTDNGTGNGMRGTHRYFQHFGNEQGKGAGSFGSYTLEWRYLGGVPMVLMIFQPPLMVPRAITV